MEHESKRFRLFTLLGGSVATLVLVGMMHGGVALASLWPISPHVVSDRARKRAIVPVKYTTRK